MRPTFCIVIIVALSFFAGSCTGDDAALGATDVALVDALAAEYAQGLSVRTFFDPHCVAEGLVVVLGGADTIMATTGVDAESIRSGESDRNDLNIEEETAHRVVDQVWRCDGVADLVSRSWTADLSETDAACVVGELGEERARSAMALLFVSDAEVDSLNTAGRDLQFAAIAAAEECGLAS